VSVSSVSSVSSAASLRRRRRNLAVVREDRLTLRGEVLPGVALEGRDDVTPLPVGTREREEKAGGLRSRWPPASHIPALRGTPRLRAMPSTVGILAATTKGRVKARPMWCRCGAEAHPTAPNLGVTVHRRWRKQNPTTTSRPMRSRSIRRGVRSGNRLGVAWVVLGLWFVVLGVATFATGKPWIYVIFLLVGLGWAAVAVGMAVFVSRRSDRPD
jgi:F0F1-type ATP synthase assembly protein I